jgi:translation initiation factor 3 subunit A
MYSQKFIWETYKILLDFTKTNSKLLFLYTEILKAAFLFCKANKRKVEFKRLCDSVRGYLQTLIKTEKRGMFLNKVQISNPKVLKTLIEIRINLLDTAIELEQWQESFKTAEDILYLMDKFEKQSIDGDKSNKAKM